MPDYSHKAISHSVTEFVGFNVKYFITAVFGFWTHLEIKSCLLKLISRKHQKAFCKPPVGHQPSLQTEEMEA